MNYLDLKKHYNHEVVVEYTQKGTVTTGVEIRCMNCDEQLVWYSRPQVCLRVK